MCIRDRNKTAWDGYNHYRTDKSGKTLLKEGKGDAGDINLNYIAALNYLGIPTFPVLLSTRGNGTLHPIYPDYSDFNYVVGVSVINEKLVFSDATSDLPFGYLPLRCLNGNGWIVSENGADSVSYTHLMICSESNSLFFLTSRIFISGFFASISANSCAVILGI